MKVILTLLAISLLSSFSFAQSEIGYKHNYEIKFDVAQFNEKEPKSTIRDFVNHLLNEQNQKFNIQTRYSSDGVIYISSDSMIDECIVEDYFYSENSSVISFERVPQRTNSIVSNNTFAQN